MSASTSSNRDCAMLQMLQGPVRADEPKVGRSGVGLCAIFKRASSFIAPRLLLRLLSVGAMQVILSKKDEAKLAQSQQGKALTGGHASAHELLSMYRDPPREEIAIDKFERLALERLRGALRARAVTRTKFVGARVHDAPCTELGTNLQQGQTVV